MKFERCNIDRRHRNGFIKIRGETFACLLETDWSTAHRAPYPLNCEFLGVAMPVLQFGFAAPWSGWIMDVDAAETEGGLVVCSQGYQSLEGKQIPFVRTQRFFWNRPEMLFEVMESNHLHPMIYSIDRIHEDDLEVDPVLNRAILRRDGVSVCWSFASRPVRAGYDKGGWQFEFDQPNVEVLIQWQRDEAARPFFAFESLSPELRQLHVTSMQGLRILDSWAKHDAVTPGETLEIPPGENMVTGGADAGSVLREVAIRRIEGDGTIRVGATRVVDKLMSGLNARLWGDAANPYLELPEGLGECYLTFVPKGVGERNWWDQPVQRIGLACYSLAAGFFLQDPDVGLLAPDDQRVAATLNLALRHLGDRFDERMITWHIRNYEAHLGYGQGQLLVGLLWAGRGEEFRVRLNALFDVARKEPGDRYLMQEVLGRSGNPNRGNKAHLTYFPVLASLLGNLDAPGLEIRAKVCLPDLIVTQL